MRTLTLAAFLSIAGAAPVTVWTAAHVDQHGAFGVGDAVPESAAVLLAIANVIGLAIFVPAAIRRGRWSEAGAGLALILAAPLPLFALLWQAGRMTLAGTAAVVATNSALAVFAAVVAGALIALSPGPASRDIAAGALQLLFPVAAMAYYSELLTTIGL